MVRMSTINGCLEREGLARLTISILVITTAGCLAYTWGYAEGVHNSRTVILPSQAAAPVILHASEVKLAGPVVSSDVSSIGSNSSAAAPHHTKRIHTRRRARKNPEQEPHLPTEPLPASTDAAEDTGNPATTTASDARSNTAGHARALVADRAGQLQLTLQQPASSRSR